VELSRVGDVLRLCVEDDGKGIACSTPGLQRAGGWGGARYGNCARNGTSFALGDIIVFHATFSRTNGLVLYRNGVSIAANKVPGIRAVLCADAETARGARLWNKANVLCLSLRRTAEVVGREILDAWFNNAYKPNPEDDEAFRQVEELERTTFLVKTQLR